MIVVDTSALLAIALKEPERETFIRVIREREHAWISSVSVLEAGMVLRGRHGPEWIDGVKAVIKDMALEIVAFDAELAAAALAAFDVYGKGIHPRARLNMGELRCLCARQEQRRSPPLQGQRFRGDRHRTRYFLTRSPSASPRERKAIPSPIEKEAATLAVPRAPSPVARRRTRRGAWHGTLPLKEQRHDVSRACRRGPAPRPAPHRKIQDEIDPQFRIATPEGDHWIAVTLPPGDAKRAEIFDRLGLFMAWKRALAFRLATELYEPDAVCCIGIAPGERHICLARIQRDPKPWTQTNFTRVEWLPPTSIDPVVASLLPRGPRPMTPREIGGLQGWFGVSGRFPAVHIETREVRGV